MSRVYRNWVFWASFLGPIAWFALICALMVAELYIWAIAVCVGPPAVWILGMAAFGLAEGWAGPSKLSDSPSRRCFECDEPLSTFCPKCNEWQSTSVSQLTDSIRIIELERICSESCQVVATLASQMGMFEHIEVQRALDNLSEKKIRHPDVLPFRGLFYPGCMKDEVNGA